MSERQIFTNTHEAVIKEFKPRVAGVERSAGWLTVRGTFFGNSLAKLDHLFDVMAADALMFEPPLVLERNVVSVQRHIGDDHAVTYGIMAHIPEGHLIPHAYTRIDG